MQHEVHIVGIITAPWNMIKWFTDQTAPPGLQLVHEKLALKSESGLFGVRDLFASAENTFHIRKCVYVYKIDTPTLTPNLSVKWQVWTLSLTIGILIV